MPIPNDKLEGNRKLYGIALSVMLAFVLFLNAYVKTGRNTIPKDITQVRVGDNIVWQQTASTCTLNVYNIISVVPPRAGDTRPTEVDDICGSLTCEIDTPIAHQAPYKEDYICFKLSFIRGR